MKTKFKFIILSLLLGLSVNSSVVVQGNKTVSTEKIKVLVDQVFDISEATKILYETGFFNKVEITLDKEENYVIKVEEKPVISEIIFVIDGAEKNKDTIGFIYDELSQVSGLKTGMITDEQKIAFAHSRICRYMLQKGHKFVNTRHEIVKTATGANLKIYVDCGPNLMIKDPVFIGLKELDAEYIRQNMRKRVKNFVLFTTQSAEPYALTQDFGTIIKIAKNEGFLKAKIKSGFTETKGDEQCIYVVLEEGDKFEFRNVKVEVNQELTKLADIDDSLSGVAKDIKINELKEKFIEEYKKSGQLVNVSVKKKFDGKFVDLEYKIEPLQKKLVLSRIIVRGNSKTINEVILNASELKQGDYFDPKFIRKTEEKIFSRTSLFRDVKINHYPDVAAQNGAHILNINVDETDSGEIGLMGSALYQTEWDFNISVYYGNPNFLGRGHTLQCQVTAGTDSDKFQFAYQVPSIFGQNISWTNSFAAYNYGSGSQFIDKKNKKDFDNTSANSTKTNPKGEVIKLKDAEKTGAYKITSVSYSSGFGFDLNNFGTLRTTACFENQDVKVTSFEKDINKSRFFTSELMPENRNIYSFNLNHSIGKVFSKTQGLTLKTMTNLNLSEQSSNLKIQPRITYTYPLNMTQTVYLKGGASYGFMANFGEKHYWIDNFQSSELHIKGITNSGPTELNRYTPIGGTQKLSIFAEFIFPFILPDAWNVSAFLGVYAGSLWDSGYKNGKILSQYADFRNLPHDTPDIISNEFCLRASTSVGIRWQIGPFKLEVAYSLIMKSHDKADETSAFQFGLTL